MLSTDTSAPAIEQAAEKEWSFSASAYAYFVPDGRDYVQPTSTADRGWLHFEARYNYEDPETGSAWVGYNFADGDPANHGGCAMGGVHSASGFNFVLPYDVPASSTQQAAWRFCIKCRAMFYDGDPADKGACAMGDAHQASGFNCVLPHHATPGANVQDAWRHCGKCRAMFYDGDPSNKGVCAAGGGPQAYGLVFLLTHDVLAGASQQMAWRYCGKCRTMFYDGMRPTRGHARREAGTRRMDSTLF